MAQLICGILRLDQAPADKALLARMAELMIADRLPHVTRTAVDGPVAMAAIRLGLRGCDGELAPPALIAANGRILAADISIYDRARLGVADAVGNANEVELLNAVLSLHGADGVGQVHGDFTFADWRDNCLTLGRDHFGARSLAYTQKPGEFLAFASLPAALLRTGLAGIALDEGVATSWAVSPAPPPGRSLFKEVRTVPAAHLVSVRNGVSNVRRYWRLDTRRRLPFDSDPGELAGEVRRLLKQAVERRLPSAGPGAGHLSGGLDSSSISVIASRALSRSGRSFFGYSFREPEEGPGLPGVGDAPAADLIAAAEPAITQVSLISPNLLTTYAEGVDPTTLVALSRNDPEEQVLQHAAKVGANVVFSGWGGDQVASYVGRGAEAELFLSARLGHLRRHLAAEAAATGVSLPRLALSTTILQALPQRLRDGLRRVVRRPTPVMLNNASQSRLIAKHRQKGFIQESEPDTGDSHENRRLYSETWYIQTRLESFARQGARHGVAYAYPLLDLDLVEFSMRVPGVFLRNNGRRRVLFRDATVGVLPDEIRLSPEKLRPFPGEEVRIAAESEKLLSILDRWRASARIRDYLDIDFMSRVVTAHCDPERHADVLDIDLTMAFQLASTLVALDDWPAETAG